MIRDVLLFLRKFLFSFNGRVNRAKMWVFSTWVLLIPLAMDNISVPNDQVGSWVGYVVAIVFAIVWIAIQYCFAAVAAKRLHDRDRPAWFLLIFVLPGVLTSCLHEGMPARGLMSAIAGVVSLWFFVEAYFLPGTAGTNRFGPDPLPPIVEPPSEQA